MILHVDMDAFYAAVEERERPELRGQPVIVGGSADGRGVVSAANYVARKFGVHSAMPAVTARRLCPRGVFLPVRMEHYARVARQIREVFQRYTPLVEPLSLDEAFLDVGPSEKLFGSAEEIGRRIKREIRDELQLVASVGVAPRKFVAKIASDLEKPDGFVVVRDDDVLAFLDPLPIERLWGVGKRAAAELHRLGVRTIGQIRQLPAATLRRRFGKAGDHLWRLANGIDPRRVVPDHAAKQISHETTFASDIDDQEILAAVLMQLIEQVGRRLRRNGFRGKTVHLKVRFSDFRTITRSRTLPAPSDVTQEFWQAASGLLRERLPTGRLPVRLLGVAVSSLIRGTEMQLPLFDVQDKQKLSDLDTATDAIKQRFGDESVKRATGLLRSNERES